MQENLLRKCEEHLPKVEGTTGKEVLQSLIEDEKVYYDCSIRHNTLVDVLKEGKNE